MEEFNKLIEYNKIIESLNIKFIAANRLLSTKPIRVVNYYDLVNRVILVKKGCLYFGDQDNVLFPGDILFLPAGQAIALQYGEGAAPKVTNDEIMNKKHMFFFDDESPEETEDTQEFIAEFCYVNLSAKVFDTVNFFTSLEIPVFHIKNAPKIAEYIERINDESVSEEVGNQRILMALTETLVVEILRFITAKNLFIEQFVTNATYFKDPRLIEIFNYIRENLDGDLSNKNLASIASVSEDYVGQYFKILTGINPQDYIEYQRMEKAVALLRTSKKSIRKIGLEVGYRDTAYFCRRFKMMFGIPAGKMRKRESLLNV